MHRGLEEIIREIWGDKPVNNEELKQFISKVDAYVSGLEATHAQAVKQEITQVRSHLEAIVASLDDIVFELDSSGTFIHVWAADDTMLFMPRALFTGKKLHDIFDEDLCTQLEKAISEVIRTRRPLTIESSAMADGRRYLAKVHFLEPLAEKGPRVSMLIQDITTRKKTEEKNKTAELIIENSPSVLFRWLPTQDWPVQYVSHNISMFGYSDEDFYSGKVIYSQIIHSDDLKRVEKETAKALEEQLDKISIDYRIVNKNGGVHWIEERTSIIKDRLGNVTHYEGVITDITERKISEQKLTDSEERLQLIFEGTSAGIWDWLETSRDEQWWSARFYEILGYTPEEVPATYSNFLNLLHPDDLNRVLKDLRERYETKTPVTIEYRMRTCDGSYKWVLANAQFRWDENGSAKRLAGSIIDISERKDTEKKLRESEAKFRHLIEAARDIFYTTDQNGYFTYVNEVAFDKTGYRPEELIGINFTEIIHEDHRAQVKRHYQKQVMSQTMFSYLEFPIVSRSGDLVWVGQNVQLLYRNDQYIGTQAVVRDITNIKNAEHALMESEERFRKLVQYSSDVTTVLAADGKIMYESPSFYRLFGYTEALADRNVFEFVHPADLEYVRSEFQRGIEKGGVSDPIEFRFLSADGNWKYVEAIGNNLLNEPTIRGIVVNSREITERKKAEASLAETNAQLAAVLESTGRSIFAVDTRLKYITMNNAYKKMVRKLYHADVKEGMNVGDIKRPDGGSAVLNLIIRGLKGEQFTHVGLFEDDKKNRMYFEATYTPILDDNGKIIGLAVFSEDITEKKQAEEELVRAKNEAIAGGQAKSDFLSNMSHEIRTPMNAIIGMTDLLIEKKFEGETAEYLHSIKYSADNLLVIINDILDFSKIDSGKITFEQIDFELYDRIEELHKLFRHKAKEKGIELETVVDPNVPSLLKGDPYRLNQILFNLVSNALKFTQNGFVKVHVQLVEPGKEQDVIRFSVQDTGIGIPQNKLESIFESFTQAYTDTTRRFGGTGLGLAITKNLTILQGGKIFLDSVPEQGTTFVIELPFRKATSKFIKKQAMQNTGEKNLEGLNILLVEDNAMNQYVARQIIGKWNAGITIANNGQEAINLMSERNFDIVLMDLQMPEMSGYQATEFIRSKNTTVKTPSIPIIALTADAFAETKRKVFEAGMNDFVTKPFNQDELYAKIIKHSH